MKIPVFPDIQRAPQGLIKDIERRNSWQEVQADDAAFRQALNSGDLFCIYAAPDKRKEPITYLLWASRRAKNDNEPPMAKMVLQDHGKTVLLFWRVEKAEAKSKDLNVHNGVIQ